MAKITSILTRHLPFLVGLNLLVFGAIAASTSNAPRSWTATAQLIVPDSGGQLDASLGTLGRLQNADNAFASAQVNPLNVQSTILTSDVLLQEVLRTDPEKAEFDLIEFKRIFEVEPQDSSTVLALSVGGSSPEIAKQRAQNWINAYQKRLNQLRQENNSARERFSEVQLREASSKLQQAQAALAQFRESTGLVNADEQTRGIVSSLSTLSTARAQAISGALASRNRAASLSDRLNLTPEQAVRSLSLGENQDYQFLRQQLVTLDAQIADQRATFTDESPIVQPLLDQRNQLQQQLQQYIDQASANMAIDLNVNPSRDGRANLIQQLVLAEAETSAQLQQAEQLQSQITQLSSQLQAFPRGQARIAELQRQVEVAEGLYTGLIAQVQKSRIDAFNAYPNVQVLDVPSVDQDPTSPKLSIALINALLASIIGSVALVLLLESRNPLLRPKDLQSISFPVVARIPYFRRLAFQSGLSAEAEVAFQWLASSISLRPIEDRRLLITSATKNEGKTTVTLNLAAALADQGFRILLVDGDFRQANLSRQLGRSITTSEPIAIDKRIDLLPTQPVKDRVVDLVRRGRLDQTLKAAEAHADYDYVLIDSAPMSLTSETVLMAAVIPNVLFVVRPGMSNRNAVRDSLDQLAQQNAKVHALVVNGDRAPTELYGTAGNETPRSIDRTIDQWQAPSGNLR